MTRLVPVLCVAAALGLAGSAWILLGARAHEDVAIPSGAGPAATNAPDALRTQLVAARRSCSPAPLDAVVQQLTARTAAPDAASDPSPWRLLAEAHLERALARSHRRGLRVGEPTYAELPREVEADVALGLAAVQQARERGDDGAELCRLEAALLGQRITGLGSALQWNSRIHAALQRAAELAEGDPRVHVAVGLRKLLAPRLLGHDPQRALEHFEFAARVLADDERPAVFAAMASYLQQKRMQAVAWLEQAVARNPKNTFARVVLQRVRRDEPEPFGRDVTAEEIAAVK